MLRQRQKAFVQYYIANGFNGTRAAISAGYSPQSAKQMASENLSKPNIRAFMEQTMKEMMDEVGATRKWRLDLLKRTADAAFMGQTNEKGLPDYEGVVKSVQELNKMDGAYAAVQTQNSLTAVIADGTDKLDSIVELQKQDLAKFVKPQ